ncbi:hypothetical protein KP509_15G033300 [Ceratopteris richardii]|uniref:Vacuolar protein sorting-associated protein 54 C-terminal domain-containing protein n=1 Tax=Ceratopteris richardii TaxID=49495 RepID=A0A8T2T5Y7_CERRI|nr:hypothetical protein KP509_15G033300 [Ceratopteris richardii]KAH7404592.1 hypothetical protein KP509_15G033300 [Ceratopteris richardii]KAH7404593.1 hypothetical protein KP509_15G033300 [Ceratopteris richardii]KAH7404594.1 hypothetical protein KP509_15G033300 [Ceratopteris richardii]
MDALPSSRRLQSALSIDLPASSSENKLAASSSISSRRQSADSGTSSSRTTPTFSTRNHGADLAISPFSEKRRNTDLDPEVYNAGQSLASILNNPHLGKGGVYGSDASWGGWLFSSSGIDGPDNISPMPTKTIPEVNKADFQHYLDSISDAYGRFADVREHSNWESSAYHDRGADGKDVSSDEGLVQGEGLVACLREIPSLYFKEDFALEDGSTFQVACPYSSIPQNVMLQEKLSHYLDIIEVHLVREIEARSESFYEAQGHLEGLNSEIVQACEQIKDLKRVVELSEEHVVESAQHIKNLNQQREILLSLHQKLNLMSYVNQALGDLPLLVAAADCGGALDVIDVLQNLLGSGELMGFHSFRHLGDRLTSFIESVNSILAADFVRVAIHNTHDLEASVIIQKFKKRDISHIMNAKESFWMEDTRQGADDETELRDQLLPLVIGLLRTSKLPEVLRVYRDTLITDIKAAIKVVVGELLPILVSRPIDTEPNERQGDVEGGQSLASKLRSLTAESFVQLLTGVLDVIQVRLLRAAGIRKIIEQIVGGLQGSYAEAAVAAAFASGAAAAAAAEAAQEDQMVSASPLQPEKLTSFPLVVLKPNLEAPSPTTISRNFRADVLRENTEGVCSACHAAHERWAKLLGVRALIHPKLRLHEFRSIHDITQVFMLATEKIGGRYASSIRGALHSQSKAFVDNQHNLKMSKITALLEQETWVSVDAPDEFQAIVNMLTKDELAKAESFDIEAGGSENGSLSASTKDTSSQPTSEIVRAGSLTSLDNVPGHGELRNQVMTKSIGQLGGAQRTLSGDVATFQAHQDLDAMANGGGSSISKTRSVSRPDDIVDTTSKGKKGRDKQNTRTLQIHGVDYHMVNSGLILVKLASEYVEIVNALPSLASEIVHRVSELLQFFNARTCQLVLGAGAMQVSGLKSITAKHLALASQTVGFFCALIPDLKRLLAVHIPETRKSLLFTEIDHVAQDYKVHKDEIHLKLVQIMKERLMAHLRTLPQIIETWSKSDDSDVQPSQFARALTKEVGVLHRVLSPILPDADVRFIFTRVVALFHALLTESFSKLDLTSPSIKSRLYCDIQHILTCMRGLPSEMVDDKGVQSPGELDQFLHTKYENGPGDQHTDTTP